MSDSHDIQKHIKVYLAVFAALLIFTVVTVAVSYIHFGVLAAVSVGLAIAIVKGSLVALFFMHLSNERRWVYGTLLLSAVFFFFVLLIPLFAHLGSMATETSLYGP